MLKKLLLLFISVFIINTIKADEGMWLLSLIGKNYEQMKQQGFRLTAEDIYNVNRGCLKDAVVGLSRDGSPFWHFCTGEIISGEGLFSTNHHCGFDAIQTHSSVEHDYLQDGFWAMSKADELSNDGVTASLLVRMADVTDSIFAHLTDKMTEEQRAEMIDSISKLITDEAVKDTKYEAQVADMFNGNQFFLLVYVTYRDVRLVGAPPQAMGKFGGDTDNWEYPRHTADFSMFRIYTDSLGNPAEYSENNIPLKPKHFFPVSVKGLEEGDFAMIMGYPGTTERFLTSYGLDEEMNITNRLIYNIRTIKINILRQEMAKSQKTRIQYASKYAKCSNYWKYSLQQNKALKKLNTRQNKVEIEKQYQQWAENQENSKYKNALTLIKYGYESRKDNREAQLYLSQGIFQGADLIYFALENFFTLSDMLEMTDKSDIENATAKLHKNIDNFYKDFDINVEKKLLANMLEYTCKNMNPNYYPDFLKNDFVKKFKANGEKYAEFLVKKSIFSNKETLLKAWENVDIKKFRNDPIMQAAFSAYQKNNEIRSANKDANTNIAQGERYFVDGILQMNNDKLLAPDANSTIRLTYGNIGGYEPKDAVSYRYYTTLKGVIEKEDPNNSEFIVPKKLKDLYYAKDYGAYADKNGDLPVCFISNNDITGGNSGSPVLDADGNLIGLAFDGNSEAMSGDIDFEENLQRCINLDVRYMLFIIDKFAGAQNLINEIKIVK
ncbi:MAG: S46 family peptidase [Prevotellaceae bacterium]|jgi:hypothetical protein|nr:S46 family peptidase [Prevotellaceae bacterium]